MLKTNIKLYIYAFLAVVLLGGPMTASATIIQADFRSELDLPFCCSTGGPRILERIGQAVPNAGFELDESDQIANPSGWRDALQVDLNPVTGVVSLTPTDLNSYETIDIVISNILFSGLEQITNFSVISSGNATTFDSLVTSFTSDSLTISYVGDQNINNTLNFGSGVDTFQIELGGSSVPAPATLALFGLGLAGLGWSRRKRA